MTINSIENNDKLLRILSQLVENPRSSIREIASATGLKYMYIRRSINKLHDKKLISFSLMISSSMLGLHVAYVKGKGERVDVFLDHLIKCNRILAAFKINHCEFGLLINGRNKEEIAAFIDLIRSNQQLIEISVEYGLLPVDAMIPIKNPNLNCKIPQDCEKCVLSGIAGDSSFLK